MTVLDRVTQEAGELRDRLDKLRAFIFTDSYAALTPAQQELLGKQSVAMAEYLTILNLRIHDLGG